MSMTLQFTVSWVLHNKSLCTALIPVYGTNSQMFLFNDIICFHTVIFYQVFLSNMNNLPKVIWFLSNVDNVYISASFQVTISF